MYAYNMKWVVVQCSLRMPSLISLTLSDSKVGIVGDAWSQSASSKKESENLESHRIHFMCFFSWPYTARHTHSVLDGKSLVKLQNRENDIVNAAFFKHFCGWRLVNWANCRTILVEISSNSDAQIFSKRAATWQGTSLVWITGLFVNFQQQRNLTRKVKKDKAQGWFIKTCEPAVLFMTHKKTVCQELGTASYHKSLSQQKQRASFSGRDYAFKKFGLPSNIGFFMSCHGKSKHCICRPRVLHMSAEVNIEWPDRLKV